MADRQEQMLAHGIAISYQDAQDAIQAEYGDAEGYATISPALNGSFTVTPGEGTTPEWRDTFRVTVTREEAE